MKKLIVYVFSTVIEEISCRQIVSGIVINKHHEDARDFPILRMDQLGKILISIEYVDRRENWYITIRNKKKTRRLYLEETKWESLMIGDWFDMKCRGSQVVRQETANLLSSVRFRLATY